MKIDLPRITSAITDFIERLIQALSKFTFWRFVMLTILVLAAAGMTSDALFKSSHETVIIKRPAKLPELPKFPAPPKPPEAPKIEEAPTDEATIEPAPGECRESVKIGPNGIQISECKKGTAADAADNADADPEEEDGGVVTEVHRTKQNGVMEWMLAIFAILWVLWFVGRSRLKVEARAEKAESVAEKEALERQVAEARLQALQAQVEPHFLFNTLGAVEHLIETDPPRAAEMQRHLIAFLRGAMPRMRGQAVTLGEEVELCRNYLAIMKIRMEDRLDYNIDLPLEVVNAHFPPMMLQSVVENAIKHGLEPKPEGGSLWISARAAAGRLRVSVADSGLGFGNGTTSGTGIGLNNIRERLAGMFGEHAALVISPNAPTGTQVTIEIPYGNNGNTGG